MKRGRPSKDFLLEKEVASKLVVPWKFKKPGNQHSTKFYKDNNHGNNSDFVAPTVSLSKRDRAHQIHLCEELLTVTGVVGGYHMVRATHGVHDGAYYWEAIILPPDDDNDNYDQNVKNENSSGNMNHIKGQSRTSNNNNNNNNNNNTHAPSSITTHDIPACTGDTHVRIGWSTRQGELQGPVGFDKWSYGYRDINGSKCNNSKRIDNYGDSYSVGDVIGCLIKLNADPKLNEMRFFKNGIDQGVAYSGSSNTNDTSDNNIANMNTTSGTSTSSSGSSSSGSTSDIPILPPAVYLPAISVYNRAKVRANFGPSFIYEHQLSGVNAVSEMQPMSPEDRRVHDEEIRSERKRLGVQE